MMPIRLRDNLEESHLFGHRLEKSGREAEVNNKARRTLPLAKNRHAWWRHKDLSPVNVVMVQTKLRNRNPRVPLLCSWPIPESVSVLSGSYGGRNVGGKPVDGDFESIDPGAIAPQNNQIINI
jgi:hypothetical protein